MTCRITWFFVDRTSSVSDGWTENFYSAAGDSTSGLDQSVLPAFVAQRLAILAQDYSLTKVRAVNVTNRFDTSVKRFTENQGAGRYRQAGRGAGSKAEQPWDRLLVKLFAASNSVRSFPLGGIPTGVIADTLDYNPDPAFQQAVDIWRDSLAEPTTAYQLRQLFKTTSVVGPDTIAVTPDKRGLTLHWNAVAPVELFARAIIKLNGVQNATPISGLWRTQFWTTNDVILFPRRRTIYGTPTIPVSIDILSYRYWSITETAIIRGMERKTGRPSEQLRGRARVRQG